MLLGVDVGGTFTDAVLVTPREIVTAKVPTNPGDQACSVLAASEAVLARAGASAAEVTRFVHGMTVTTNALLEGVGARTVLVATEGFEDLVELGRQARPSLYRLCEAAPAPLVPRERRVGAPERSGPAGPILALRPEAADDVVAAVAAHAPEAVAVVLLHSYAHPEHERILGRRLAERLPGVHVSLSHEVVGTFREFERAATTEVDAALSPLLRGYLGELERRAREAGLPAVEVMQSSGGATSAERAAGHAALTVLSGPAGGVGGALLTAADGGEPDVLCFDMGGTSCDVCMIADGAVRETATRRIGGRPLALPMLDIHTVGAGGGSIAWRDAGGALRVGPQSAGADPGPACYGRGGERPTVTDANVLLGYLPADGALAGRVTLDADAARSAVEGLARELGLDTLACAAGIVAVANAEMLGALRVVTVQRGIDPRGFTLLAFGGAGPLHATALAAQLGIRRIQCPRASGVLSALGLAAAAPRSDAARTVLWRGAALAGTELRELVDALTREAAAGLPTEPARVRVGYELRYAGQSFELPVEVADDPGPGALQTAFAAAHHERYGYEDATAEVELVTVRVSVWGPAPALALGGSSATATRPTPHRAVFDGVHRDTLLWRGELAPGTRLPGPAVCALPESTLVIAPGWSGEVDARGNVGLEVTQ